MLTKAICRFNKPSLFLGMRALTVAPIRTFAHTVYHFDAEDYDKSHYQVR